MKNLILFLVISFLIAGCHTIKKATLTKSAEISSVEIVKKFTDTSVFSIDTSKSSDSEIVYKKTEYYPPTAYSVTNPTKTYSMYTFSDEPAKGSVKSEETLTVKAKSDAKGKTEVQKAIKLDSTAVENKVQSTSTEQTEEPAKDPKRFRYIFYILILIVSVVLGVLIYFKMLKLPEWLKTAFSGVLKFFKSFKK
jgi:uncharacterized protein YceK